MPTRLFLHAAIVAAFAGAPVYAQTTSSDSSVETLAPVTVQSSADASAGGLLPAYAGGQVSRGGRMGLLGNLDTMDSPFNSTQYTNQLIKDQQAASVADILQNDPGVRNARGFGNFQQVYMVRGFPLFSDDITYNGLYGLLPRQYLASEFIERLDVFRGANAFLNGAAPGNSGLGGSINVVPKRAPNEPLSEVTLGWESGNQGYAALDLARRFGPDDSTGIRLNAVRRDGGTAVDDEKRELSAFGLGLDWRGERARLSADLGWQDHRLQDPQPSINVDAGLPIPSAPNASTNLGPGYIHSNERDLFGTIRGEFDITDKMTAWAAVGGRSSDESSFTTTPKVINLAGDMTMSGMTVTRKDSVKTGEVGLRAKFDTGSVGHTVNISANHYRWDSRNAYISFAGVGHSNLYSPVRVARPQAVGGSGGDIHDPLLTESIRTTSFAIADTMSLLDNKVLFTAGLRHQKISSRSYNYNTGESNGPANSASRITPVAGLVIKATDQISLYANYIEGLSQIGAAPATFGSSPRRPVVNVGATFDPVQTKQKEVGIKYDGGKIGASLALFTSDQPSAYVDPDSLVYGVYGKQRNRGAELSVYGEPVRGLRVLGGVTLLDAKQVTTVGGANDGNRAIGVPRTMANLGLEWDVPGTGGLTLTGQAVYTSSQYADAANKQELPAWTRFDLGARYLTEIDGHLLTLRANVINVANKNYWASAGGYPGAGYLVLGAPRTVMLSATLQY
ncbi:TonB-dependent receptor [Pollutimonas sp. M17]|uniref:TonB-dependent receptor n=1 Tax=Pollutimonas sp. M17 TaxID=2962065 RepID=UPI0021F44D16|nr:TonB-dependent receptor [Pollutimonas sp. M17]UYO94217.1 TonB-dependent receptor [Pollutimonas sp. M17]